MLLSTFSRPAAIGALACFLLAITVRDVPAQPGKSKTSPGIVLEDKVIAAADGAQLHISYYNKQKGTDTPVVVMVHATASNRLVWRNFAEQLAGDGYAVITVDLRGHGQSKPAGADKTVEPRADDYKRMILFDLEAVKEFIFDQHQEKFLNMRKMAIIGADSGAVLALQFAQLDWAKAPYDDGPDLRSRTPKGQDVRALVLLSPAASVPSMPAGKSLAALRNPELGIAFWIGVGSDDSIDGGQAEKFYEQVSAIKQNKPRSVFRKFNNVKLRGTDLLNKGLGVENQIVAFLNANLKQLNDPWRDRRSRVARDS